MAPLVKFWNWFHGKEIESLYVASTKPSSGISRFSSRSTPWSTLSIVSTFFPVLYTVQDYPLPPREYIPHNKQKSSISLHFIWKVLVLALCYSFLYKNPTLNDIQKGGCRAPSFCVFPLIWQDYFSCIDFFDKQKNTSNIINSHQLQK